jgi:hypothetical protein
MVVPVFRALGSLNPFFAKSASKMAFLGASAKTVLKSKITKGRADSKSAYREVHQGKQLFASCLLTASPTITAIALFSSKDCRDSPEDMKTGRVLTHREKATRGPGFP